MVFFWFLVFNSVQCTVIYPDFRIVVTASSSLLLLIYPLPTFLYRMTLIFIGTPPPLKIVKLFLYASLLVLFVPFSNDFYFKMDISENGRILFFLRAWFQNQLRIF